MTAVEEADNLRDDLERLGFSPVRTLIDELSKSKSATRIQEIISDLQSRTEAIGRRQLELLHELKLVCSIMRQYNKKRALFAETIADPKRGCE